MLSYFTRTIAATLAAVFILTFAAMAAITSVSTAAAADDSALTLVTIFGFLVGLSSIAMAFYLQLGPRTNIPLTPTAEMPARAPTALLILGAGVILTSMRIMDVSHLEALFWRLVGYAVLLTLATGLTVSYVIRHSNADEEAFEHADD